MRQRMQKALTQMNVELANVISDVSGLTGQAIIRAMALAAHFELQVERTLLDALKERQACMRVALQSGESKKRQARQRDCDGEPEINMTQREFPAHSVHRGFCFVLIQFGK